jgi:hypothetical protein
MFVKVAQMFEDGGRPLPRNRAVTKEPSHVGKLSMCEQHDMEFRRSVTTAYLRTVDTGVDVLPPLRDAVVRWIGEGTMTISGFQQDQLTNKCAQQSWLTQLVAQEST